jgi:excisionase family DNA binding protein
MANNSHENWWTRREAAAYAHVSEATIGREVRTGRLRHARVGGRRALRFRREWLDDWLAAAQPVGEPILAEMEQDGAGAMRPRYVRSVRRSSALTYLMTALSLEHRREEVGRG